MSLIIPITFATRTGELQLAYLDQNFTAVKTAVDSTSTLLSTTIAGLDLGTISGKISPSQLSTGGPYWDTSSNLWIGASTSSTTGTAQLNVGILGGSYTGAANPLAIFSSTVAGYNQIITQNKSSASNASNDIVVSNNLGSDTTYYGDFGINSSNYSGSGSLSLANATYLYSNSGDLVLGTSTSNGIHFVVNSGSTDAMAISSTGVVTTTTPTAGNSSTQVATTAYVQSAGYNSQGIKTISSSTPSGGNDGDIWYQV